jgi:hypothetical protein
MPSLDIFECFSTPEVVEVVDCLEVNVSDETAGPEIIEVLQGPPGPTGPPGPQGAGTVESVNGYTGPHVVLTATDVQALPINSPVIGGTY